MVPWSGARALLDVVGIYFVALVSAQLIAVAVPSLFGGAGRPSVLLVLVVATPVAVLLVAVGWLRARYGSAAVRVAGRVRWRAADLGVGFGVGLACFIGQQVLFTALVWVLTRLGSEPPVVQDTFRAIAADPVTAPVLAVTAVLLAPASEELLFRGVLFEGLRARWGFWIAAFGSAGLFTLAHVGDAGGPLADGIIVAGILPLGLVFATLMERRGSLLACMVAHATYNLGGVALLVGTAAGS
ncbi:hypothetical protein BH23ACT10_BH23ACT10_01480 [soil metagenome]